ncbi:hypothetical protein [Kribbella sp. NBC_00359]|uniref:hypothetical protein n=1 Tax=Kribbella sp. NBC_00359 TaxID=2975966 RepID=UPI002E24EADE
MTETELKRRLSAGVDDIEAPPDLLDRARVGGDRRLRRRRLTALAAGVLAVTALAGAAIGVPAFRDRADQAPVATSTPWMDPVTPAPDDPYAFLMKDETRGDLAGTHFIDEVQAAWRRAKVEQHGKFGGIRGNFWDSLRGSARIYWAGNTPAGRVAIVLQHYQAPTPDPKVKYALHGIYTAISLVSERGESRPEVGTTLFPNPDRYPVFVVTKGTTSVLVALDMGKPAGWSTIGGRPTTPLHYKDGVAVVALPLNVTPEEVVAFPLGSR